MEGLGTRVRRDLSSAICKYFPWTPGCDSKGSGGGGTSGNGGTNTKPATSTSSSKAAASTTPHTTSSTVKQNAPTTTPVKDPAGTTTAVQAEPPTTAAAGPVAQSSPNAAGPSPSASTGQQQQQPAPDATPTPQAVNTSQPANQDAPASAAPKGASSPQSSDPTQDHANTAVAVGAGTALGSTPTASPGYGKSPTDLPSADLGLYPTSSSGGPVAANTRRPSDPTSGSTPGTVISGNGGKTDQGDGATTSKGPAIAGAVVGVIMLIIITALLYRYRRSRVVQPLLLPFAKTSKRGGTVPYQDSQIPKDTMSENLLGAGLGGATLQRAADRNSQPYSVASSDQQWMASNQSRPLTKPQSSLARTGQAGSAGKGLLRVAIPRERRLVPLGGPVDPSSLSAGFSIPPSPSGSPRNSVSGMHTTERASSRPSSRGSVGNVSIASSGAFSLGMMAWPVPPRTPHSQSSVEAQDAHAHQQETAEQGQWSRP
ncbi:hypothetical protein BR93DRAFT_361961 [Coniochaeta sp. PMI_546]|nr:hypothetical protein BR93DRAFT_361961 [Coniochaeta sp. PMI_546]